MSLYSWFRLSVIRSTRVQLFITIFRLNNFLSRLQSDTGLSYLFQVVNN